MIAHMGPESRLSAAGTLRWRPMAGHEADILRQTDALRALARGLLDPHAAEDVVQDAWVASLQRRERPANPFAWMAGTTRRLVARTLRSRARGSAHKPSRST